MPTSGFYENRAAILTDAMGVLEGEINRSALCEHQARAKRFFERRSVGPPPDPLSLSAEQSVAAEKLAQAIGQAGIAFDTEKVRQIVEKLEGEVAQGSGAIAALMPGFHSGNVRSWSEVTRYLFSVDWAGTESTPGAALPRHEEDSWQLGPADPKLARAILSRWQKKIGVVVGRSILAKLDAAGRVQSGSFASGLLPQAALFDERIPAILQHYLSKVQPGQKNVLLTISVPLLLFRVFAAGA
jgi:hypothetical protein